MIRKSGWLVFLVLLGAVLALVYLLAGVAIRAGTVYVMEKAVGAEVNIGKVSLRLAPLSVRVDDLQITDASNPTHNSLSFKHANAALDVWPALLGYYVVDDLSVSGLGFGTERQSPGKVYRGDHATEEAEAVDLEKLLRLDLPDADELMARANLQTVAKGQALQQQAQAQKELLENLKSQLPNEKELAQIQAEIEALTQSKISGPADLATKTQQLKALQDTLRAERDQLRQVQEQLVQSREQLQTALKDVREAGVADWQQLQQLANIKDGGLAPVSQILLGDLWGERIGQLEALYNLAKPYLPKGSDAAATSPEATPPNRILPLPRQPYPSFWVKTAQVNWLVGGGEATISLEDITAQHHVINKPTRFALDVQDLPRLAALEVDGDFAILQQMVTNVSWKLDALKLDSMSLGRGENLLDIASGLVDSEGSLKLVNDQIEQQAQVILQQPDITSSGNKYLQQVAVVLDQQSQIPLSLKATGSVQDPTVSVRSTLDWVLGDALLGEAKEKIAALETELRSRLNTKISEQLGGQEDWLALLDRRDSEAEAIEDKIEELLNARLADVKTGAKDRLKDTLLNRGRD